MKYALVTGASTGIGRETAIELSKSGYEVGLIGRNLEKLEETKKLIGGASRLIFLWLTWPIQNQ